ncbi:putative Alpha-amylase A type-1/2 [Blattamonas nauphoetae]|uniref:alpha-amylase n=1 Tax=Blattamonas nauphoetae TaxID=2049346 RepID=A0ABQ9XA09_9EUKA|nr:putative Alpha-amylase A type-1/2 [Blattamonas nauphoetae]
MFLQIVTALISSLLAEPEFVQINGLGHSAQEWKSRIIYQILTDRFATNNNEAPNCNLYNYCGGTFKGIQNHLDYIKNLGMNAIWISPVIANTDGSYHGYHATDFYSINHHFGSADDLKNLVRACHEKDIWVMVDIVVNHVGDVGENFGRVNPFNSASHYHSRCDIKDYNNQHEVEYCRLANLPDLDTENDWVKNQLAEWTRWLITTFDLDGLRVDTVKHVNKNFWRFFVGAVPTYLLGEVFDGRVDYIKGYTDIMPGQLHYPIYYTLLDVFRSKQSCYKIRDRLNEMKNSGIDHTVLGSFISNHDNKRFLNMQSDWNLLKSCYAFILIADSIPIVYYGDEQGFSGGDDPNNREPMWNSGWKQDHQLFKFIAACANARKKIGVNDALVERYVDDQFYAFSRGQVFVALTNKGSNGGDVSKRITFHPFKAGDQLVDYISGNRVSVGSDGFVCNLKSGCPVVLVHG